jgi:hypothetical protein
MSTMGQAHFSARAAIRTQEVRGGWQLATDAWRLATDDWRLATGDWRLATGDWRLDIYPAVFMRRLLIQTGAE